MKRNFFLFITVILLISSCTAKDQKDKTVNVSGTGTVTFVPDMVRISVHVQNINNRLEDSLIQTKETISGILDICKKYNIDDKDIKSSYISTNKEYNWISIESRSVFKGYSASQNTEIVFRNLERLEDFSGELLKLKITSMNSLIFDHSERNKYEAEANLLALDNAKKTAEKIAERMNVKLEEVIYIADSDYADNYDYADYNISAYSKSMRAGVLASPGILSTSKKVLVKYKIK